MSRRVFLSCATRDFGPLRKRLRSYLTAAGCEVRTQEDFDQKDVDVIEKLDVFIGECDAVIHLIGNDPGSVADEPARLDFLGKNPGFLSGKPDLLAALGDFSDLTYTQWEAFLAAHRGVRVRGYHLPGAQPEHRERLKLALPQRYTVEIADESDLLGQLIGDLREILPELPERRISNLPASIGTLFKGRDEMLERLRASLSKHHAAAVTAPKTIRGLGGIGKTQLAIEYGQRHAEDYHALLLVRADSGDEFRRNLAELTGPLVLDLPDYGEPDEEARLAAALRWLGEHPGWYLIVDNVDTEEAAEAVQSIVETLSGGHVVITSRIGNWSAGVETLDLSVLEEDAAVAFLEERTAARRPAAATDGEDVRTLVRKLDGLALALEQAGAYIAQRRVPFAKYLEHWETRREKVLQAHDQRTMRYPASVAVTWRTTFEEIGDEARRLLEILAELSPAPIPRGVIEEGEESDDLEEAFFELEKFSLVRFLEDPPDTFSIHRLVQEIVRGRETFGFREDVDASAAPDDDDPRWLEATRLVADWAPNDGQDISTWDAWTLLDPHLKILFEKSRAGEAPDLAPVPDLLDGFALFQEFRNGAYSIAEPLYRRALEARERLLGSEHSDTLSSVNNVANILESKGDYTAAEPLYRRALEAQERVLGAEHPEALITVNNLAYLLYSRGDYPAAEPLYRRALEAQERVLGAEHPDTLTSMNNLALLLYSKGDLSAAEPLYRRTLEAQERVLGVEHPDTLTSVNNLGLLLSCKGEYAEAEPLCRRALVALEGVLGAEHPSTLVSVKNLAKVLQGKGDLSAAEPLFRRAAEGFFAKLGPDHPHTQTVQGYWDQCHAGMEVGE